ncbi:MAG: hypothetical protein MI747_04390 [Desulfobacterales bacterium]|nr:hypothetical protein [Desulfobacterales bacterium]
MRRWHFILFYPKEVILGKSDIPFQPIDWKSIPKTAHKGETGLAPWQTVEAPGLGVRVATHAKGTYFRPLA